MWQPEKPNNLKKPFTAKNYICPITFSANKYKKLYLFMGPADKKALITALIKGIRRLKAIGGWIKKSGDGCEHPRPLSSSMT